MNNPLIRKDPFGLKDSTKCFYTGCCECHVESEKELVPVEENWEYDRDYQAWLTKSVADWSYLWGYHIAPNMADKSMNPADLNPTYFIDNSQFIKKPDMFRYIWGVKWPVETLEYQDCWYEICDDKDFVGERRKKAVCNKIKDSEQFYRLRYDKLEIIYDYGPF